MEEVNGGSILRNDYMDESPKVIKDFLGYMQTIKGKSPKTVDEYFIDLRTFFRYMKHSRNPYEDIEYNKIKIDDIDIDFIKGITITDVYEYMNYLIEQRKNGASARARKSSSLRSFFDYLTNKVNLITENPIKQLDTPKQKRSLPKYLTLDQSMDLLKSVIDSNSEFKERDYCIVTLFLNCGMRLSELVNIDCTDIYEIDGTIKITGKGNKERIVYLNHACIDAINRYKTVRKVDGVIDKKAFFLSRLKKRISVKTVQYLVKEYLRRIGLEGKGYSVHKLRHTAATLMYQHGQVDIRVLKDILGHQNLGTTEIYTHLSSKQMEEAINANPLSEVIMTE